MTGPIPAGEWLMVGDGIIIASCDVLFEILWRPQAGDEVVLLSETQHFDPLGDSSFEAQAYEHRFSAPAVDARSGDELVWRFSVVSGAAAPVGYIPNGDGALTSGRIPFIQPPAAP